ncbi:MAG TPA: endolytic transglycosylase MltG [Ktedonobacteraceae bacterium]|nr:endolytic transglycosylase MltG [Ktedonobacteraceae bacterium]
MRRPGSSVAALISVLLLGAIIFLGVYYAWNTTTDIFQPVSPAAAGKKVPFEIKKGETTTEIADDLQSKGLIRNALAFSVWARIKGLDRRLQAGVYSNLNSSMTISDIIDKLLTAEPDAIRVTIPEGWRLEQISNAFASAGLVKFKSQDFLNYTKHIDQFPDKAKHGLLNQVPAGKSMEGLLFPSTYDIPIDGTATDTIDIMLTTMENTIQQNHIEQDAKQHQLTLYQAITLASIVEREVRFPEDRGNIASVYWNRLTNPKNGTVGFLQADPTVQYARDSQASPKQYWTPLNDVGQNIAADSPWNTYTQKGLPPTPICSPGLESLKMSSAPPATDYYYFLAKPDGHSVFAKTNEEFQQDVQKYLH